MGYNLLFRGLTTYLYWGYNPVTKYHGHPSICSPFLLWSRFHEAHYFERILVGEFSRRREWFLEGNSPMYFLLEGNSTWKTWSTFDWRIFFRWDEEKSLTNSGLIKWDPFFWGGISNFMQSRMGNFRDFELIKVHEVWVANDTWNLSCSALSKKAEEKMSDFHRKTNVSWETKVRWVSCPANIVLYTFCFVYHGNPQPPFLGVVARTHIFRAFKRSCFHGFLGSRPQVV